ncbi:MAG: response regulator [Candidatus Promineifilaceae bacterium]|nr:response regulator [Candidatus Promineifilaceae bacterium]
MATKILIIDDHPDTLQLMELALQRRGYHVTGALSGVEGLRAAEKMEPDLVLLDIMMPKMDGIAVLREIRAHQRLNALPVIMFTAKNQAVDKQKGLEAGADDYLAKPTQLDELVNRIEGILARGVRRQVGEDGDLALSASLPQKGTLVLVLAARGGAGATQTAINLATSLSVEREPVTLVDLDARQGHVALYLKRGVQREVADWLQLPVDLMRSELEKFLVPYSSALPEGKQIDLMLSRPHLYPPMNRFPPRKIEAMVRILLGRGGCTVVDMGPYLATNAELLLQAADRIILCLSPERPAIIGARRQIQALRRIVDSDEVIQPLLLDYGFGKSLPQPSVESYLGQPLAGVIAIDRRELAGAVDRSQPLVTLYPESNAAARFRQLAEAIPVSHTG